MTEVKNFGFITLASPLSNIPNIEIASEYQTELLHMGGEIFSDERILDNSPLFYFVLTGGTEKKVLNLWQTRKKKFDNEPMLLLAHPGNNSLPSALEILARLNLEGAKGKIIYLDFNLGKECWNEIAEAVKQFKIFHQLRKTKIGLIGKPSDWLIASMPGFETIKGVWGPEICEIDLDELINGIDEISDSEIEESNFFFTNNAAGIIEADKKQIKQTIKIYTALKKIIKKYKLTAISLRCFDLVEKLKTTGCYALSKLNDEGIIAGCEGDLVSTLGMLWANLLTDQSVWMANPARINEQNNSILLAHCTVPLNLADSYKIRSHFESGMGVGIQGELSKGKATLFRLGGRELNKLWISNVEIFDSSSEENLCRTQINVKLHGNLKANDILKHPLGNHMLLVRGSHIKEMQTWFDLFINRG